MLSNPFAALPRVHLSGHVTLDALFGLGFDLAEDGQVIQEHLTQQPRVLKVCGQQWTER